MFRIIRTVDAFFERAGEFAVPRDYAESVFETSAEILSNYIGKIAISSVRPMNVALPTSTIHPQQVRLGNAKHSALLTSRRIDSRVSMNAYGVTDYNMVGSKVVNSKIILRSMSPQLDPLRSISIYGAVHEGAHSYRLEHCNTKDACVMKAELAANSGIAEKLIASGEPFCTPCAEDLEIAGYMELALLL